MDGEMTRALRVAAVSHYEPHAMSDVVEALVQASPYAEAYALAKSVDVAEHLQAMAEAPAPPPSVPSTGQPPPVLRYPPHEPMA